MITGVNSYETKPYISKYDQDKSNPTTFQIGVIDSFIKAHIEDQTAQFKFSAGGPNAPVDTLVFANKRNILAVKFGLRGLDNFMDPQTNKAIKFDTISVAVGGKNYPAVTDEILRLFTKELIEELAEIILNANRISEGETKN